MNNVVTTNDYARLCERLRVVPWFTALGQPVRVTLPFTFRQVGSITEALECIQQPSWEDWTQERAGDLSAYLAKRAPGRHAFWNQLVKDAKRFVTDELEPRYLPPLPAALSEKVILDCVRWDLLSALMEAAYADLKPASFFTQLVSVYESGHLPVGWEDGGCDGRLLIY